MASLAFMKATLQMALDQTNAILGASGVPARLQLANTKEFNIMEESLLMRRTPCRSSRQEVPAILMVSKLSE